MTTLPTFCFVVPCFNEEGNVKPTVGSIRAAMGARSDYEIILVNDASTDRTLEEMRALAAEDPRIRVLDNPTNLGFGGSYKRGAGFATATYVMMLPGDDGFPGQSIAEVLGHAGEAADERSATAARCSFSVMAVSSFPCSRRCRMRLANCSSFMALSGRPS